jgi:putative transcriptional regulator
MPSSFKKLMRFAALLMVCVCVAEAQSKRPEDLATGKILVTPRSAADPLFAESVILLVRYDANGALGLMVNRRTTVSISRALREIAGAAGHSEPVFVGGPVELDTVFALARAPQSPEGAKKVFGDVYFIAARPALEKAIGADTSPSNLRIYIGYCGWGPQQLENEVRHGAWHIFSHNEDAAFDAEPSKLWRKLVAGAEDRLAQHHLTTFVMQPSE